MIVTNSNIYKLEMAHKYTKNKIPKQLNTMAEKQSIKNIHAKMSASELKAIKNSEPDVDKLIKKFGMEGAIKFLE